MIVREKAGSFVLIKQHDHALASGLFAQHWAQRPYPLASTLHAIAQHDVAWRGPDSSVRWNEETGRPYSFLDYPAEEKVRAYGEGLDLLEAQDPYAACLCSMHYETLAQGSERPVEARFVEREAARQERLKAGLSAAEVESLGRNLRFLKLCDGLSLFVCLNEPGDAERPPPYPGGFEFDGGRFEPVWEDERTLRLDPTPLSGPFYLAIPYEEVGKDRRHIGGGRLELRVTC